MLMLTTGNESNIWKKCTHRPTNRLDIYFDYMFWDSGCSGKYLCDLIDCFSTMFYSYERDIQMY